MKRLMFMVLAMALLLLTPSCGFLRSLRSAQPDRAWVVSSRTTYGVLAPSYRAYMATDTTTDQDILLQRGKLLDDWLLMIEVGEAAVGIPEVTE